jgi:hypothetical protein
MKLVEVTRPCQMSYMQNPLFNVFTLAATSHYRNWGGVNSNRAQHAGHTATMFFGALYRYRGSKLPPINNVLMGCVVDYGTCSLM